MTRNQDNARPCFVRRRVFFVGAAVCCSLLLYGGGGAVRLPFQASEQQRNLFSELIVRRAAAPVEEYISSSTWTTTTTTTKSTQTQTQEELKFQPVKCSDFLYQVHSGESDVKDPNEGIVSARFMSHPFNGPAKFFMSVHNAKYDRLRYSLLARPYYYEKKQTAAFIEILKKSPPSARVIDVGANQGWYAFLSASLGHHVDAFEPNKKHSIRMCESIQMNGWSTSTTSEVDSRTFKMGSVNIYQYGVMDKDDVSLTFQTPHRGSAGSAKFTSEEEEKQKHDNKGEMLPTQLESLPVLSLDHFADTHGWFTSKNRVDIAILKVDVEGFQDNAINGAKRLLLSGMVKHIFMEVQAVDKESRKDHKENQLRMVQFLVDAGYELYKYGGWPGPAHIVNAVGANATITFIANHCANHYCNVLFRLQKNQQ